MNKYIVLILIILLIVIYLHDCNCESFITEDIDNYKYYNEKNELINHKELERDEQEQAFKYIEPTDVVLELGGRYGTVSAVINYKLNNKKNHVVVEPDENIVPTLIKNRELNNSGYYILSKVISNSNKKKIESGYSTHYVDSNDNDKTNNIISYEDFKKKFPLDFNVIVADCEGCLADFLKMMGDDFYKINKVIFEADMAHLCNYDEIIQILLNNGFTLIEKKFNIVDRYVFIKN
jgi:FkbM family methyltransferase